MTKPQLELLPGTLLILPTAGLVSDFLERMGKLATRHGFEMLADAMNYKPIVGNPDYQGINHSSVANLAAAMFCDILENTSLWVSLAGTREHSAVERQWRKMVKNWNEVINDKKRQGIYSRVEEEMFDAIHDMVLSFDGATASWNVWYVRPVGYDMVVEKGPDYRILDWTRRMEAGAEYLKQKDEGMTLPSNAWLPDEEGKRFAELMEQRQHTTSLLPEAKIDQLKTKRGRRFRQTSTARAVGKL